MWLSILIHVGTIAGVLAGFLLVGHILRQRQPPATSLGWLLFVVFVPYLGIPLYLALGTRKLSALSTAKERLFGATPDSSLAADALAVEQVLAVSGVPGATRGNRVNFHDDGGTARAALLELIEEARDELAICTYILGGDAFGEHILARLTDKAAQGVRVRLLLDGVGSFFLPKTRLNALQAAGGEVAWFIPVLHRPFRGRTNLRNHRKYVVMDGQRAWAGGRNLAEVYFDGPPNGTPWIDFSYDLSGAAALHYQFLFEADWAFANHQDTPARPDTAGAVADSDGGRVQVVPSGPDVRGEPLRDALLTACYQAQRRIIAVTPYYVPDEGLQEALCLAARRGVDVDLILPARSNHPLADIARRRYLDQLMECGARVWLLPAPMLHAKAIVFDETLALAGSANLDRRSLFLNFEVVALFLGDREAAALADWLIRLKQRAARLGQERRSTLRHALEGLVLLLAYQL